MAAPKITVDIQSYMETTLGLSDVHIASLPPEPVNAYAVIEYPGVDNIKTHGGGLVVLDNASIQIQARHQKEQTALDRIHVIVDALDSLKDVTINGTLYKWIDGISRPRIIDRIQDGSVTYIWECSVQALR